MNQVLRHTDDITKRESKYIERQIEKGYKAWEASDEGYGGMVSIHCETLAKLWMTYRDAHKEEA